MNRRDGERGREREREGERERETKKCVCVCFRDALFGQRTKQKIELQKAS